MEMYMPPLNITNLVTVKIIERNYLLWKNPFETFINAQKLQGFVTGSFLQAPVILSVPSITTQQIWSQIPTMKLGFKQIRSSSLGFSDLSL